jgi:PAS domain S-box-containing protein
MAAKIQVEPKQQVNDTSFFTIFERHHTMMLIIEPESGAIIHANPAAVKFYGYPLSVLSTMFITDINQLPPEEVEAQRKQAQMAEKFSFVFPHRLASGEIRTVEVDSSPIQLNGKELLFSLIHDVTERRRAEEALLESERRLDAVFNGVAETMMMLDVDGKILAANDTAAKRWGVPVDELVGKNAFALSPEAVREKRAAQIQEMIATERPIRFEDERAGAVYDLTFYPVTGAHQSVNQFIVFSSDITERKRAEEKIRMLLERFYLILSSMHCGVLLVTGDDRVEFANQALCDSFGLKESPAELQNLSAADFIGKIRDAYLDPDAAVDRIREIVSLGQTVKGEDVVMRSGRTFLRDFIPIRLGDTLYGRLWIHFEITLRKRAEGALRESEDRYRSLVESSPDGVVMHRDGIFLYANSTALSMYGADSFEQLRTKTVLELIHGDDLDGISERMQPIEIGQLLPLHETRIQRFDGRIMSVETVGCGINYQGGHANQIIIRDITERKKRERELHRLNRTYRALSNSSQAMMRATSESQFMNDVCDIIREDCQYTMVWIGFADDDRDKTVRPVMYSGFEEGYLEKLKVTWADTERGQGPTGSCIRAGRPSICGNMLDDPKFLPWRDEAMKRGYASSIALPLHVHGEVFGALTIYSRERDGFSADEVLLLTELADDLACGITALRLRTSHARMEEEIRRSRDVLEQKVIERTQELTRSEERFRTTLDNLMEGCMIVDCAWTYLYVNEAIARQMGRTKKSLVGHSLMDSDLNVETTRVFECYRTVMEQRIRQEIVTNVTLSDGATMWFELHCVPVPEGIFVMSTDITERNRAELTLRQYNQQLQGLSQRLIEAQEAERRKIAIELHDEIGQVLTAVQLNLRGIVEFEEAKDVPARLEETITLTQQLLQQVRELSVDLRPWMLDQLGLVPSVRWYADKQAQRGKIKLDFITENITGRFAPIIEITSYRIIQESMTNILRHAQATEVSIRLINTDGTLVTEIRDNGIGFDAKKIKEKPIGQRGLGAIGMKERVTSIGGTLEITSEPGKGTSIKFRLPLYNS